MALLIPRLIENTSDGERSIIYASLIVIGAYGNLRSSLLGDLYAGSYLDVLSVGGFLLIALLILFSLALLRGSEVRAAAPSGTTAAS